MRDGKREMLIGAVGLVKGSVRHDGKIMVSICDELEPRFEESGFLKEAPFKTISMIFYYGSKWGEPVIGKINKRHSELEVGVELPMSEVRLLDEAAMETVFKGATQKVLIAVAEKYGLPISGIRFAP